MYIFLFRVKRSKGRFVNMLMKSSVLKPKSLEAWVGQETRKLKLRDRYWSDPEFRKAKNEANKKRSRERVCCDGCKMYISYGSMLNHKKVCRGYIEPTPLELLTKRMEELNI
jgi:hypothetical protein